MWYVAFTREIDGVPIEGAQVEVRIRNGKVVFMAFDTFPSIDVDARPQINEDDAIDALLDALPDGAEIDALVSGPQLVIVPMENQGQIEGVLSWRVELRTRGVVDWARWFIDARTGEVVAYRSLMAHGLGSISARVDDGFPGNGYRDEPLRFLDISGSMTAVDGTLDITNTVSGSIKLAGRLSYVLNEGGYEYEDTVNLSANDPDQVLAGNDWNQAELDVYAFVGHAKNLGNNIYSSNDWVWERFPIYVNINQSCNAYYDGWSINFFRSGNYCNNTGRVEGVVYHEFGHGFHYAAIVTGNYSGSMGEGAADYLSASFTNDYRMARGFFTNGDHLRDVDRDKVYPYDWTNQIHSNGLIYAGAIWDLREELINKHSYYPGVDIADRLYYATLQGSDNMTDAYMEAILAADDDGNLNNGVRDGCLIYHNFREHGLAFGPEVYSTMELDHTPPASWTVKDGDLPIEVTVYRDACGGPAVQSVEVLMEGPDGSETIPLTPNGSSWSGELPAPTSVGRVHYVIVARDGSSEVRSPQAHERFSVLYTDLEEILCDDFENGFGEWTHGAETRDDRFRAPDEWEVARPQGRARGPVKAFSGDQIVGLDLGGAGDGDGFYEAELYTWLRSPVYDVSGREGVRLQFWRWLGVEDEEYDDAVVSVNGEEIWRNRRGDGRDHHQDTGWVLMEVPIDAQTVQVEFSLTSDERLERDGWAIDRLCLLAEPLPVDDDDNGDPDNGEGNGRGENGHWRVGGCACNSATSLGSLWWVVFTGPIAFLRRQRRDH